MAGASTGVRHLLCVFSWGAAKELLELAGEVERILNANGGSDLRYAAGPFLGQQLRGFCMRTWLM